LNTYLLAQESVSLVPILTRVFPVASVAFCVKLETQGRTVDLLKLIVAAAALSAVLSHPPNKPVKIVFVSMYPPGTGPKVLSTAMSVETLPASNRREGS